MSAGHGHVLVVGSGVIGAACAYYLARDGWRVTTIDQGEFGRACSHGNCGFVCPSHVLPLAAPGAVGSALKALFTPNSPLSIKLRFDPSLWAWLYRFARRCKPELLLEAGRAIQALLNSSRLLYPDLLKQEGIACEWQERGLLFVFQTRAAMEHYVETDKLLRDTFHLPARRIDSDELTQQEPALKPGLAGGWHYPADAHLRPDKLMSEWRRVLEKLGVTIKLHCSLDALQADRKRVQTAIVTTTSNSSGAGQKLREKVRADAFVLATGAWTPSFARQLGCRIPIQPGKGYSITMPRPRHCPAVPLIFEEHRVAVTPMLSGYRLGSTMEFAGYDTTLKRSRLDLLREGARPYLLEPSCAPVEEEWFGWRPMTPDGLPIIGQSPALDNVWIAAGHNMLGLSMAPGTGKLVAELLGRRTPHVDPAPYSATRF
jgi:D-amino-acid dehydrogenase